MSDESLLWPSIAFVFDPIWGAVRGGVNLLSHGRCVRKLSAELILAKSS